MREIVLDTETTGFEPSEGHRIVEIGAVELMNHMATGRTFHCYLNPERPMPKEAFEVHGLGDDFLRDKPLFRHKAQEFLDFIADAPLVIHNASFDIKFLSHELRKANFADLPLSRAIDTVQLARQRFPGSPASLDALCRRFGIDNSMREKHGALLDSEILAEVYLELIGGRQPGLGLTTSRQPSGTSTQDMGGGAGPDPARRPPAQRPEPLPSHLTEAEAAAHQAFVEGLGPNALWLRRA